MLITTNAFWMADLSSCEASFPIHTYTSSPESKIKIASESKSSWVYPPMSWSVTLPSLWTSTWSKWGSLPTRSLVRCLMTGDFLISSGSPPNNYKKILYSFPFDIFSLNTYKCVILAPINVKVYSKDYDSRTMFILLNWNYTVLKLLKLSGLAKYKLTI